MTNIAGTLVERDNNRRSNEARRVRYKRSSSWADLPQELLEIVSKSLNIVDYRNLGRVCRSWRLFYSEFKQSFLTSHSPLVAHASGRVNKYCYFFDLATGMEYKRKLPRYIWDFKFCLGVSSGYLILFCLKAEDVSRGCLWVINPFTGHQIQFPCMPRPPCSCIMDYDCDDRGIFASQGQDFLIMILSEYGSSLQLCTSRDKKWKEYHYDNKGWHILDIIVFDGRIYVLNSDSQIGIFNLRCCDLRFLELKFAPHIGLFFDQQVRLVASNDQLFVVDSPELYRIDLSRMEWVKLYDLGDQALFRGKDGRVCSKVINPSKWGGQSNCAYSISISKSVLYPRQTITTDSPEQGFDCDKICSLYFLHQLESVRDD